jgi:quercetin dioxygenase-like cupin family protein
VKILDIPGAARAAVAANANRPATAVVHDSPDARLVVFRVAPGQAVPPHRNASTVTLTVISGRGFIRGGDDERAVAAAEVVVFEPNEVHGMRAELEELVLLAMITPRPGTRADAAPEPLQVERATAVTASGEQP